MVLLVLPHCHGASPTYYFVQVGAAEGVTAQLEEVASQLSAYKAKLAAAQEEVRD